MTLEEMKQKELLKLYIRKTYSKNPKIKFNDPDSEYISEKMNQQDIEVNPLYAKRYMASLLTLDEMIQDFIIFNNNATIINIGNGLDSRKTRIKKANTKWYYVGNEELNTYYNEYRDETFINKDPFDYSWLDEIKKNAVTYLIVLEDFVMYQDKEKVLELIDKISNTLENVTFAIENVNKHLVDKIEEYKLSLTVKELVSANDALEYVKHTSTFRGEEILKWYKIFIEGLNLRNHSRIIYLHKN